MDPKLKQEILKALYPNGRPWLTPEYIANHPPGYPTRKLMPDTPGYAKVKAA